MKQTPPSPRDNRQPASAAGLRAAHGSAALDRRVRLNMTAKRMEQLVNDLAENMNLRRWKRADLIDCINWQQWLLCDAANDKASLRMKMLEVLTSDMLPNAAHKPSGDQP